MFNGREMKKEILNGAESGEISRCIKANYYKMGDRNFIFTKADCFSATCVMIEYE